MDKLETIAEESEGVPGLYNVCFDGNFSVPITSSVLDTQEIGSNFNLSNPQDVIIADISYSTPTLLNTSFENATHTLTSKESEEINLRSLLTKWNLASLTDHFICKFFFCIVSTTVIIIKSIFIFCSSKRFCWHFENYEASPH